MRKWIAVLVLGFAFLPVRSIRSADLSDKPEAYDADYVYDPDSRPDPFVPFKSTETGTPGPFSIESVTLVGITRGPGGFTALLKGSDGKVRFLRQGDRLSDGQIMKIEADRVLFKQTLPPDEILRDKEVVKTLHPEASGSRK